MFKKLVVAASLMLGVFSVSAQESPFTLTILHTNDTHAAHEANSAGDGGAARLATVVTQIREQGGNVLLLDGGDRFTGTLFHQQYRGADQVQIMNAVGYDAMTLGNHEFDDGDQVLANFIDGLNFPVVSSNVDVSASEILEGKVLPYVIFDVNGVSVGVTGLTTPETPILASPGPEVVFHADMAAVTQVSVDEMTAAGANVIILVTHIGLSEDMRVAAETTGVDVIVGGHSHTLLGNAYVASAGEYPVIVENPNGEPVYIVQAGSNTTYLGRLNVTFDEAGVVTAASGDTIFLSQYITPDAEVEAIVEELAGPIEELRSTEIGAEAIIHLVGNRSVCRVEECILGNLIAEALLAETGADLAITNGGGIRAEIDAGPITLGEVLTVLPFGNLTATVTITGAGVIEALENGVSQVVVTDGVVVRDGATGRFPQVAGLRFSFDPTQEAGSRIVSVEVRGADGTFAPIDTEASYVVATNDFARNGGDGYEAFANGENPYDYGKPMDQALAEYLVALTIVEPELDGRIEIINATLPPLN